MASIQGEVGLRRAVDRSNRVSSDWSERAYQFMLERGRELGRFATFEAREFAGKHGFESPASPQAWGHPIKKLAKNGLIRRAGSTDAPDDMHGTIVRVWEWV